MNDIMVTPVTSNSPAYLLRNTLIEEDIDTGVWQELPDSYYVHAMTASQWFTTTGLDIPADATEADVAVALKASRAMHQSDAWVRGDLIEWLRVHKYNSNDIPRQDLMKLADELGVASFKRLLNNATTARAWPLEYRHPAFELSYSHHEELNALPLVEKQAWADRCIAEGLSISALRTLLHDDAVSITPEGTPDSNGVQTQVVSFSSEKVDTKTCAAHMASAVAKECTRLANGKPITLSTIITATENVLVSYHSVHMVKFPARAWADALGTQAASNGKGDDEE